MAGTEKTKENIGKSEVGKRSKWGLEREQGQVEPSGLISFYWQREAISKENHDEIWLISSSLDLYTSLTMPAFRFSWYEAVNKSQKS